MVSVAETEAENQCKDLNLKKSVYAVNQTQDRNLRRQALYPYVLLVQIWSFITLWVFPHDLFLLLSESLIISW